MYAVEIIWVIHARYVEAMSAYSLIDLYECLGQDLMSHPIVDLMN